MREFATTRSETWRSAEHHGRGEEQGVRCVEGAGQVQGEEETQGEEDVRQSGGGRGEGRS